MKSIFLLLMALSLFAAVPQLTGRLSAEQFAKLGASDAALGDYFGYVAVDGNTVVVGANGADSNVSNSGAAYVYEYDVASNSYVEVAILTPSDSEADSYFGYNVAISGDTVVVGSYKNDEGATDAGAVYVFEKGAAWSSGNESAKLTASDAAASDNFGYSVAIEGDTIVVGSYRDDDSYADAGSVYIYEKGSNWSTATETKITASSPIISNAFGISVAISGDMIAVGATKYIGNKGGVYLLQKTTQWSSASEVAILTASDGAYGDSFGVSVAINSNTVIVGALSNDTNGTNAGAAYVFEKGASWSSGTESVRLVPADIADNYSFGNSVSLSGDTALIGASGADGTGAAYLFRKNSAWGEYAKLTHSPYASADVFGKSVAISENTMVVGSPWYNGVNIDEGIVYIFKDSAVIDSVENEKQVATLEATDADGESVTFAIVTGDDATDLSIDATSGALTFISSPDFEYPTDADTNNTYEFMLQLSDTSSDSNLYPVTVRVNDVGYEGKRPVASSFQELVLLEAQNPMSDYRFGSAIAVDGSTVVVGVSGYNTSQGGIYVYEYYDTNATFELKARLQPSDGAPYDSFGSSVAISGDVIVVGAYENDVNGSGSGAAYVFEKPLGGWENGTETLRLSASDIEDNDYFGTSVAIDNDVVVVGSLLHDDGDMDTGAVYLYEKPSSGWSMHGGTEDARLRASDIAANDRFGGKIAMDGNTVVVGSYQHADMGAAYLYEKPLSGWSDATEDAKLDASDLEAGDYFGISVAVSGKSVAIGNSHDNTNSGAVYLYDKPLVGWDDMNESVKLTASDSNIIDYFGGSVALNGDTLAVGSYLDDDGADGSGSVYIFTKPSAGWSAHSGHENAKRTAADANDNDHLGFSVATYGEWIFSGAFSYDHNSSVSDSGGVYVFKGKASQALPSVIMYLLD